MAHGLKFTRKNSSVESRLNGHLQLRLDLGLPAWASGLLVCVQLRVSSQRMSNSVVVRAHIKTWTKLS